MSNRFSGVVVATVRSVEDPEGEGRIRVEFPWLQDTIQSAWAAIAAPMSGPDRGMFFMPEEDDEVLVAFQHGDFDHPFIMGFLWNGAQRPPSEHVRQRMIRSVNGHTIRFVDSTPANGDMGALIIECGNGNLITMSNGKITIKSTAVLELTGQQIILNAGGVPRVVAQNGRPI